MCMLQVVLVQWSVNFSDFAFSDFCCHLAHALNAYGIALENVFKGPIIVLER